jgi:hypothetical protein
MSSSVFRLTIPEVSPPGLRVSRGVSAARNKGPVQYGFCHEHGTTFASDGTTWLAVLLCAAPNGQADCPPWRPPAQPERTIAQRKNPRERRRSADRAMSTTNRATGRAAVLVCAAATVTSTFPRLMPRAAPRSIASGRSLSPFSATCVPTEDASSGTGPRRRRAPGLPFRNMRTRPWMGIRERRRDLRRQPGWASDLAQQAHPRVSHHAPTICTNHRPRTYGTIVHPEGAFPLGIMDR